MGYFKIKTKGPFLNAEVRTKPDCTHLENKDRKAWQGSFIKGKKNGLWTYWHKNGSKKASGNFLNGKKDGTWYHWNNWCIPMPDQSPVVWKKGKKISVGKKK